MMSMRYGTIPIVRETGGLKDTVDAYNEYEKTGTGFSFKNYNAHEMLFIIRYAENVFTNNKAAWQDLVRRAMDENFSWDASARQYERRDSMAARTAIEIAVGKTVLIVMKLKSGAFGEGKLDGILYLSPMRVVSRPHVLLRIMWITVARMITMRDPGIFFVTFGHMKRAARERIAMIVVYASIVLKICE